MLWLRPILCSDVNAMQSCVMVGRRAVAFRQLHSDWDDLERTGKMAIRKILLPLTGTAAGEAALTTSLIIANRWKAHVTALHVRVDSRDVAPLAGEGLSGAMIEEMMSATEKESSDRAHAVRSMFERFVARQDVVV